MTTRARFLAFAVPHGQIAEPLIYLSETRYRYTATAHWIGETAMAVISRLDMQLAMHKMRSKDFADKIGMTPQTISRIKTGMQRCILPEHRRSRKMNPHFHRCCPREAAAFRPLFTVRPAATEAKKASPSYDPNIVNRQNLTFRKFSVKPPVEHHTAPASRKAASRPTC